MGKSTRNKPRLSNGIGQLDGALYFLNTMFAEWQIQIQVCLEYDSIPEGLVFKPHEKYPDTNPNKKREEYRE